jgi:hypothetical protein
MSRAATVVTSSVVDGFDRDLAQRRPARWNVRWRAHLIVLVAAAASCSLIENLDPYDNGGEAPPATSSGASSGSGGSDGGCGDACGEPCVGFSPPSLVAEETAGHYGLVVDAARAFWLAGGAAGAHLMSSPKDGGTAAPIVVTDAGAPMLPSLTADSTTLYWSLFGKKEDTPAALLSRIDKQAGGIAVLTYVPFYPIGALVEDGNNVYWSQPTGSPTSKGVHKSLKEAGGNVFLVAAANPGAIALDASNVYFGDAEGDSYFIRRVPKGGAVDAGATDVASGTGRCSGLAVDSSHAYWTLDAGTVCKAPLDGGGTCEELAKDQDSARSILLDDQAIYWTTSTSVMCLPRSGGPPQVIAADQGEPRFLVSDGAGLYWMNAGVGVMGMRR